MAVAISSTCARFAACSGNGLDMAEGQDSCQFERVFSLPGRVILFQSGSGPHPSWIWIDIGMISKVQQHDACRFWCSITMSPGPSRSLTPIRWQTPGSRTNVFQPSKKERISLPAMSSESHPIRWIHHHQLSLNWPLLKDLRLMIN